MENTTGKKPLSFLDKDNVTFSTAINTVGEEYKYHQIVLNIRKQMNYFSFSGEFQIPPKLIKTGGNFLMEPLKDINSFFNTDTFHDLAKRASVKPIDTGGTDKHTYTNYKPVNVF